MAVIAVLLARWRLVLEIGLCLAVLVANVAGKRAGASFQRVLDQVQAAQAVAVENGKNREKEIAYERTISELRRGYAAKAAAEAVGDAHTLADLGSGVVRLRLPVARRCPAIPATATAAARVDAAGEAELAPATATALFAIAADGDRYARQLTALQAWALDAVRLCSSGGNARR